MKRFKFSTKQVVLSGRDVWVNIYKRFKVSGNKMIKAINRSSGTSGNSIMHVSNPM